MTHQCLLGTVVQSFQHENSCHFSETLQSLNLRISTRNQTLFWAQLIGHWTFSRKTEGNGMKKLFELQCRVLKFNTRKRSMYSIWKALWNYQKKKLSNAETWLVLSYTVGICSLIKQKLIMLGDSQITHLWERPSCVLCNPQGSLPGP